MNGAIIAAIRKRAGLSQAKLARVMRVNCRTVQKWEYGERSCEGPATVVLGMIEHGDLPARIWENGNG